MSEKTGKEAPLFIYLQCEKDDFDPFNEEITWCWDKIEDTDTCYIRAGVKRSDLIEQIRELRAKDEDQREPANDADGLCLSCSCEFERQNKIMRETL